MFCSFYRWVHCGQREEGTCSGSLSHFSRQPGLGVRAYYTLDVFSGPWASLLPDAETELPGEGLQIPSVYPVGFVLPGLSLKSGGALLGFTSQGWGPWELSAGEGRPHGWWQISCCVRPAQGPKWGKSLWGSCLPVRDRSCYREGSELAVT